jgi:ABC-type glycerol-3-phosphate transport system substrate-binding protein
VNWFSSFGAEFYAPGYVRSTLDTPAGLAAFSWLDTLVRRGYVPEGPQSITDDDALAIWQTGKVAAMPMRPSWVDGYMIPAVKAGTIKEPFRVVMVPFPRAPGVERVQTVGAGNMIIVSKQTDATKLKMIEELVQLTSGREIQSAIIIAEGFPTRSDVPLVSNNPYELLVRDIAKTAGFMNVGYSQPWYYEIRALLPEILREMYAGKITPEQARDSFVARSNAILSK